jgi:hypothetical protein
VETGDFTGFFSDRLSEYCGYFSFVFVAYYAAIGHGEFAFEQIFSKSETAGSSTCAAVGAWQQPVYLFQPGIDIDMKFF